MAVKPNFFLVGAPRCGTQAMFTYLSTHPEITMPRYEKEPHYFATDFKARRFERFRNDENKYLSLFAHAPNRKAIGEASVFYLYSQVAAQEIYDYNPDARIVAMVRNPVDMVYSYYLRLRSNLDEDIVSFEDALAAEENRKQGKQLPKKLYIMPEALYYREIVKFSEQIQRYYKIFGADKVLVIVFDDFKADTAAVFRKTLDFLGVDPSFQPDLSPMNSYYVPKSIILKRLMRSPLLLHLGDRIRPISLPIYAALKKWNHGLSSPPSMKETLRHQLQQEFTPEVEQLSELLGRDLMHWCNKV